MGKKYLSTRLALPVQRMEFRRGDLLLYVARLAPQGGSANALLMRELDEINNWARLGGQLYFGWFTLMLTVNGLAVGWIFTHNGPLPPFAPLLFGVFIVLDLMATVSTYYIRNHMLACDTRITAILEGLARHRAATDPPPDVQSPVPREAVRTVFLFTGSTMFLLLIFWMVITVWGMATNFSRVVAG
jgi:hypothetical protein